MSTHIRFDLAANRQVSIDRNYLVAKAPKFAQLYSNASQFVIDDPKLMVVIEGLAKYVANDLVDPTQSIGDIEQLIQAANDVSTKSQGDCRSICVPQYEMHKWKNLCEEVLISKVNSNNNYQLYYVANKHGLAGLANYALQHIGHDDDRQFRIEEQAGNSILAKEN